ncbi:hypothetical protein [Arthrobacter sp. CAN_C5]|nr:hypothetical protein [Arthrobacter sp. CAN_C5]MBP2216980.1 hypothetical protein [Arthrobacter sp. CAN_C5]
MVTANAAPDLFAPRNRALGGHPACSFVASQPARRPLPVGW